jgi:hypothetical protein
MSNKFNGQFQIYKKGGALQMSLIPYNAAQYKSGAILVEMATCTDYENKTYDWRAKINFALGINDLCQVIEGCNPLNPKEFSLMHVPPGAEKGFTKKMQFKPGEGKYAGTWMVTLMNSERQTISVPLSPGEMKVFQTLISNSLTSIVGFDLTHEPREARSNA